MTNESQGKCSWFQLCSLHSIAGHNLQKSQIKQQLLINVYNKIDLDRNQKVCLNKSVGPMSRYSIKIGFALDFSNSKKSFRTVLNWGVRYQTYFSVIWMKIWKTAFFWRLLVKWLSQPKYLADRANIFVMLLKQLGALKMCKKIHNSQ